MKPLQPAVEPSPSLPPSNSLINLLVLVIQNALKNDLANSAIFFAERLHALLPSSELAIWLLSLSLLRAAHYRAVVHLLRTTPIFLPSPPSAQKKGKARLVDDDPFGGRALAHSDELDDSLWEWNHQQAASGVQRTANAASSRCALVYSKACSMINRPKEGLEVYLKAIDEFGVPSAAHAALLAPPTAQSAASTYSLLGSLAYRAHEYERADSLYRNALGAAPDGHLCWEAFEGLCQTTMPEAVVDVDEIFGRASLEEYLSGYMELDDTYILGTACASTDAHQLESLPIASTAPLGPKPPPLAPKDAFRILGTSRRTHKKQLLAESSFGESSRSSSFAAGSFERSYYAHKHSRPHPLGQPVAGGTPAPASAAPLPQRLFNLGDRGPASHVPVSSTPNMQQTFEFSQYHPPPMPAPSPLFTTFTTGPSPVVEPLAPLGSRGLASVKRTRSQTQSLEPVNGASAAPIASDAAHLPAALSPAEPRTSEGVSPGRQLNGKSGPTGEHTRQTPAGPRETKRAKSNGNLEQTAAAQTRWCADKAAAVGWLKEVLKKFGKAYLCLSRFRCEDVLLEVAGLPGEQTRSWRTYCLIGRARFEMLDYKSAEVAFRKAREAFPHLVAHMDTYSTLLWHLRSTTQLSFLAQELQLIDSRAPETWVATGNLFSRLEEHGHALQCFQRASQLDGTYEYAYTLSGHECLMLEEYARSQVFFRESLRRSGPKNYNALFGLGECYYKQDKLSLAEFFFSQAENVNPENGLIICAIGKVYEKSGRTEDALEVYGRAMGGSKGDNKEDEEGGVGGGGGGNRCVASVRFARAKVLFGLGRFEAAKRDLEILVSLVPTEYNVRFLLGRIYARQGMKRECIRELTFAQDLEPKCAGLVKKVVAEVERWSGEGGKETEGEEENKVEVREDEERMEVEYGQNSVATGGSGNVKRTSRSRQQTVEVDYSI